MWQAEKESLTRKDRIGKIKIANTYSSNTLMEGDDILGFTFDQRPTDCGGGEARKPQAFHF